MVSYLQNSEVIHFAREVLGQRNNSSKNTTKIRKYKKNVNSILVELFYCI